MVRSSSTIVCEQSGGLGMSQPFEKRTCRPRDHLVAAGRLYPNAWRQVDEIRAVRGREGMPNWPDWCFMPMAGCYAIVSGGGPMRVLLQDAGDIGRLAALGAWRVTQGIYRFDPALYEAIVTTPVDGDLPHDVLYRLPEWCVYVETPGLEWLNSQMHGFFAHLEWDANTKRPELRLLIDSEADLTPIPLHLGPWSLAESIARMLDVANIHFRDAGHDTVPDDFIGEFCSRIEPMVSLLLYLCSQNAEIGNGMLTPALPIPKRTRKGLRLFPPDKPTTWDVGIRLGSALRRAHHAEETGRSGTHAGQRPHVRRAHWHGFRSGPMKRHDGTEIPAAERAFILKWLPPIPVNLDDPADLPVTIRPVNE